MTSNQNFRVGVSLDISAARSAFRKLEDEFKSIDIDGTSLQSLEKTTKALNTQFSRLAKTVDTIDKAFKGRGVKDYDARITQLINALKRLEAETRDNINELERLGVVVRNIGTGLRSIATASRQYAASLKELGDADRPLTELTNDLDALRRGFSGEEVERFVASLKTLASSLRTVNAVLKDFDRVESTLNFASITADIRTFEAEIKDVAKGVQIAATAINNLGRAFGSLVRNTRAYAQDLKDITARDELFAGIRNDLNRLNAEFAEHGKVSEYASEVVDLVSALRKLINALDKISPATVTVAFEALAEGVERLRRAFATTDDDARRVAAEIRDLADAMRALDRAQSAANSSSRRLTGSLSRQAARSSGSLVGFISAGSGAGALGLGGIGPQFAALAGGIAIVTQLGQALAEATRRAAEFVISSSQISAEFDLLIRRANVLAGGDGFNQFFDAALEQGRRTVFTAREAANALGELARAGFDVEESISALPGVLDLAASDQLDLEKATLITARTLRGFNLEAERSTEVADVLAQVASTSATNVKDLGSGLAFVAPIAAQLDVPLQEIGAAMGVLGDNGFVAGRAGRALRQALGNLVSPTAKQKEAMDALGLSLFDAEGNFVGIRDLANQLADAELRIGNNATFSALAFDLFGKRAAPQFLALAESAEELEQKTTEAFGSFGRAAEIADETLAGLEGSLVRLRSAFESEQIESFIGSGLNAELAGAVNDIRSGLGGVFDDLVDPLFSTVSVGLRRLRSETFPDIVNALGPLGETISDTLGGVFDFIVENDESILRTIQGIADAIGGLIDTFIGFGAIVAPIFGTISNLFSKLDTQIQSALVGGGIGALSGAGIGAAIGALGGPIGIGVGALAGTIAGALSGAIGDAIGDASLLRQAAEFGTEFGKEFASGIASGAGAGDALGDALSATTEDFLGFSIDDFSDLRDGIRGGTEVLRELQDSRQEYLDNLAEVGTVADRQASGGIIDDFDSRIKQITDAINGYRLAQEEVLTDPAIQQQIEAFGQQGQRFIDQLRSYGLTVDELVAGQAPPDVIASVITDPIEILERAQDGFSAIDINGVPATIEEAAKLTENAMKEYQASLESGIEGIAEASDDALAAVASLEEFQTALLDLNFGDALFSVNDSMEAARQSLSDAFDFSLVFNTEVEPGEGQDFEAFTRTATFEESQAALADALLELPKGAAKRAQKDIDAIFADSELTLAEQQIAAATVVDQAFLEQRAQEVVDSLTAVTDRIAELEAQKAEVATPIRIGAVDRIQEDPELARRIADQASNALSNAAEIQRQIELLQSLVGSGDIALAGIAATSDTVLSSLETNFQKLQDQEDILAGFADGVEARIEVALDSDAIQKVVDNLAALPADIESGYVEGGGADVFNSTITAAEELPASVKALLGISSPSTVFEAIAIDIVGGLSKGWNNTFSSFETTVILSFQRLAQNITSAFNNGINLNVRPPTTSGTTGGFNQVLHTGGQVLGGANVPIIAQGGEYVIRSSSVAAINRMGLSLDAINRDPTRAFRDPIQRQSTISNSRTYNNGGNVENHHNHNWNITSPVNTPSPKRLMREAEKAMVKSTKGLG